ncbi:MAG: hypothetical protein CME36_12565 [unclassified Hahellaceae]|nr:hypothetical protein [Hahellaceae bacterium]|tara:strand:- start:47717 stop:49243 length:1527 start_codon:yes stop_codon:yes gene_type:complete
MNSFSVKIWAIVLAAIGIAIAAHKIINVGLPLTPQQDTELWTVQAQATFTGTGGPAKFALKIPSTTPNFLRMDEDFISSRFGLSVDTVDSNRVARWAVRRAKGTQNLYYRVQVARANNEVEFTSQPDFPEKPEYVEPYKSAIESILRTVREESADVESYVRALLLQLNASSPGANVELLLGRADDADEWTSEIIYILKGVRIPARKIWGFTVSDSNNSMALTPLLQVHNGERWFTFNPRTAQQGLPPDFLVWMVGDLPVYDASGAKDVELSFSVTKTYAELMSVVRKGAEASDSLVAQFSLFSLPVQGQNVYRLLLMVPLGALFVVFLRTFVGVQTFGTFMPILIALAFRETQLFWGIVLFSGIVAIGLMIRFYLERMMLLLIPRLAAILVIVVILMLLVSLATNRFELDRLLSISLFPMVILAMTIERMSITWEENGAGDAMKMGIGSLIVACLGYLIMTNESLMYVMFVFPELLLVILGLCLWMGRYTGYRLTELFRFNAMRRGGS